MTQSVHSFTELRKSEKMSVVERSHLELKQSVATEYTHKKLKESNSTKSQTQHQYQQLQRRYQLPISAKLEGKPIIATMKKPQTSLNSSSIEQMAQIAASRLTKGILLNSQKQLKGRSEKDILKTKVKQSAPKTASAIQLSPQTSKIQQSSNKSVQTINASGSKDDISMGQNNKVFQHISLKTPSKIQTSNGQRKKQTAIGPLTIQAPSMPLQKNNQNTVKSFALQTPTSVAKNIFQPMSTTSATGPSINIFQNPKLITSSKNKEPIALISLSGFKRGQNSKLTIIEANAYRSENQCFSNASKVRGSFRSEDAVTNFSGNRNQKQTPLEPIVTLTKPQPLMQQSRPAPILCDVDEATPLYSQQKYSQSQARISVDVNRSNTQKRFIIESSREDSLHAKSNLENAMNFHRRSSQKAMINLRETGSAHSLRQEDSPARLYLNPTVSESEYSNIINENVNSDGANNGDEDLETDGEQRYETYGEETSQPVETPTVEILIPTQGSGTPNLEHTPQILASVVQVTDQDISNEQDNAEFHTEDNFAGLENDNRSLKNYSLHHQKMKINKFGDLAQPHIVGSGTQTSRRPQVLPCDDQDDKTLPLDDSRDLELHELRDSKARTIDETVAQSKKQHETFSNKKKAGLPSPGRAHMKDSTRLTLRQVLNLDKSKRKSVYVDRSELLSLDPIRSRSFVKSSREFKRQNETERAANQSEVQISIKTPAQIFGSTLSSFLKIKATKAYEFGEGLVRSITSDKRKISEHFMLEEQKNKEGNASNFKPKKTSQAQPKSKHQFTPEPSVHAENVDTQVMNIEADFEQLDIGEEPIFERNVIKRTTANIFKDKMSILQVNSSQTPHAAFSPTHNQEKSKSSVPSLSSVLQGEENQTKNEVQETQAIDFGSSFGVSGSLQDYTMAENYMSRYANMVDFESSLAQFVPLNKRDHRQTFGHPMGKKSSQQKEEEKIEIQLTKTPLDSNAEQHKLERRRKSMTNSLAVPSEDTMSTTNPQTLNRRSPAQRLELNDRRRSNRSTYVERSLFGTAIESLFGKDSIFGALDKPLEESTPSSPQQEGVSMQTGKLAGQSLKRKHSSSETLGSDASNFKAFRTALLPPPSPEGDHNYKKYTLVLDLDETLVHFEHRKMVYKVRPLCIRFLTDMAKLFEIVIFTAAHQTYANFILDKLDPDGTLIQHRLYRQHTSHIKGAFIKDLSRLGRPLEKVVIIDNLKENFQRQKDNGIECGTWKGNIHDRQLNTLSVFLTKIATEQPDDVRGHIIKFKTSFNPHSNE